SSIRRNPFVRILTRLTHPHRYVVVVAKIQILLYRLLVHGHPVFVKGVGKFVVERWTKYFEVVVPLRAAKKDDVVLINGADAAYNLAIQRLQFRIEIIGVKVWCDGFVQ